MKKYFYTISREHFGKVRLSVTDEDTILHCAEEECARSGESLEGLEGIKVIEGEDGEARYERYLEGQELFDAAVKKLGDDGRLFKVYPLNEDQRFIEDAGRLVNRWDEAVSLVDEWSSI